MILIKLFLRIATDDKSKKEEIYVLTFPIKKEYLIEDYDNNTDIIAIPFYYINQILKEKNIITNQVFSSKEIFIKFKIQTKRKRFRPTPKSLGNENTELSQLLNLKY